MDTYWVPGVNNSGQYGRWAFAEFTEVYEIETVDPVTDRQIADDTQHLTGQLGIQRRGRLASAAASPRRARIAPSTVSYVTCFWPAQVPDQLNHAPNWTSKCASARCRSSPPMR